MNVYEVGDVVTLEGKFRVGDPETGTLTTPTTATLSVEAPNGTVTTYAFPGAVSNPSAGILTYNLSPTQTGYWKYRWVGTGVVAAATPDGIFYVAPSSVGAEAEILGSMPCEVWTGPAEVAECRPGLLDEAPLEKPIRWATDILFALSGHRFTGACERTVRPCQPCSHSCHRWAEDPYARHRGCASCAPSQIRLDGIWQTVTEVKVDGAILVSARWRLDENRWLVRLPDADGARAYWACSQRLDLADTEEGTFSVTGTVGIPVPHGGRMAAAELAAEFALACSGKEKECRLPRRITSIVRQGINIALADNFEFLKEGRTGLYAVDLWLASVNPTGSERQAVIASPDYLPARRVG
jgi:hypothetical protein